MKNLLLLLFVCSSFIVNGQDSTAACCTIIGINPGTYSVTARNNSSGQLFMFRAEPLDIENLKLNDAVTTNNSNTYVSYINGIRKQYFVGPVNLSQQKSDNATGLVNLNYTEPCCKIITTDPNGVINVQNKTTGETFSFHAIPEVAKTLKSGDLVYTETLAGSQNYVLLQSPYKSLNGILSVYAYPFDRSAVNNNSVLSSSNWSLAPVAEITENVGRLNTNFQPGAEWGIDIYTHPAHKPVLYKKPTSNETYYEMVPGNYTFKLNNVSVSNVPVEKGKETKLKVGYLNISKDGAWALYDDSKATNLYSGTMSKKLALPVGNYQLKINNDYMPISIREGEVSNN
jgi:hypothetical protein